MALAELLAAFETEAGEVTGAKGELDAAKVAVVAAQDVVNAKTTELTTETEEARASYQALLTALAARAEELGIA